MGKIDQAVELLLAARNRTTADRGALPSELAPGNLGEAYAIQHEVTAGLGVIGGWKVLVQGENKPILCTALPISYLRASGARFEAEGDREMRIVLAVRLAASLAREAAPFALADAEAAIATIHPAAELLEPRLAEVPPDSLIYLADSLAAGPLVVGGSTQTWRGFDPTKLAVRVRIDRRTRRHEGRAELNIPRLLLWLAEYGATWTGGPLVGHLVEVGLGLPTIKVAAGSHVRVAIDGLGRLDFHLAPASA